MLYEWVFVLVNANCNVKHLENTKSDIDLLGFDFSSYSTLYRCNCIQYSIQIDTPLNMHDDEPIFFSSKLLVWIMIGFLPVQGKRAKQKVLSMSSWVKS